MKKVKGIDAAIKKFTDWPATARIFFDSNANRVFTETFVNKEEGRFFAKKNCVRLLHSKEWDNSIDTLEGVSISKEELISLLNQTVEEE